MTAMLGCPLHGWRTTRDRNQALMPIPVLHQIVQHLYRISSSSTTRLVAQAVVTARREPCDSWSSGRLWSEGTPFQGHGETGSPASGDESMAGR